jgi:hypothetical protein
MLRSIKMISAIIPVLFLTAVSFAGDAKQEKDSPIICIACTDVSVRYDTIKACWPGDTISVPVLITNSDTLINIELFGMCSAGLTYNSIDTTDTPWTGDIIDNSTVDSSYIELQFVGGVLPTDSNEQWVIDIRLNVDGDLDVNDTLYLNFGERVDVTKQGSQSSCYVTDTIGSEIIIPPCSTAVFCDFTTVYSSQGSVHDDATKDNFLPRVPLYLYTSYPCSSFTLAFEIDTTSIKCDSIIAELPNVDCAPVAGSQNKFWVSGYNESKPGPDSTFYLGDLSLRVDNYKSIYNDTSALGFCDTIGITLLDTLGIGSGATCTTFVTRWSKSDEYIRIDSIAYPDTDYIDLPQYTVTLEAKDALSDSNGYIEVPVTIIPSFYVGGCSLYFEYDSTYVKFDSVKSSGGTTPVFDSLYWGSQQPSLKRYVIYTNGLFQNGKYIEPNVETTIFTICLDLKPALDEGDTTAIWFWSSPYHNGCDSPVFDWFPGNDTMGSKIERNIDHGSPYYTYLNATLTKLFSGFNIAIDNVNCTGDIMRVKLDITGINLLEKFGPRAFILYDPSFPPLDSITAGDWAIDSLVTIDQDYRLYEMYFAESIDTLGIFAHLWMSGEELGGFSGMSEECWIEYNGGLDTSYMYGNDWNEFGCDVGFSTDIGDYVCDENYFMVRLDADYIEGAFGGYGNMRFTYSLNIPPLDSITYASGSPFADWNCIDEENRIYEIEFCEDIEEPRPLANLWMPHYHSYFTGLSVDSWIGYKRDSETDTLYLIENEFNYFVCDPCFTIKVGEVVCGSGLMHVRLDVDSTAGVFGSHSRIRYSTDVAVVEEYDIIAGDWLIDSVKVYDPDAREYDIFFGEPVEGPGVFAYITNIYDYYGYFKGMGSDSWIKLYYDEDVVTMDGNVWDTYNCGYPEYSTNIDLPVPALFTVTQNYPNPFNDRTNISFYIREPDNVCVDIYDILGRKIINLASDYMQAGNHTLSWDGKNSSGRQTSSGVYFYTISYKNNHEVKKMLYLK